MIVNRHRQRFLGDFLPDAKEVQLPFDLGRLGNVQLRLLFLGREFKFTVQDVFAEDDTVVADIDARPRDELPHFGVGFAAETAHREIGGSGHGVILV
jgi:hypothetical protein